MINFKSYLDKNIVFQCISRMIEESKYCSHLMKKHFNKELVMTKKVMKMLRTRLNVGSGIMIILTMILK